MLFIVILVNISSHSYILFLKLFEIICVSRCMLVARFIALTFA